MNLHKAKGLEAEVVILAAPLADDPWAPTVHVRRGDGGRPTGGLVVMGDDHPIAQPPGWAEMAGEEARFAAAERVRLLYVAVTRARRELVVARSERITKEGPVPDRSRWSALAPALDGRASAIAPAAGEPPGRRRLERGPAEMDDAVRSAGARLSAASAPSFHVRTVTESAKAEREEARAYDLPLRAASPGAAWGRAVHRALEALGRGRGGRSLRAFLHAVARDEGLEDGAAAELERTVERVRASGAWRRLTGAGACAVELPVMRWTDGAGGEGGLLLEGVVDAASLGSGGWTVVDWKTDGVDDEGWRARAAQYARQVEAYAEILSALSGRPASGAVERVRRGAS
jgi:ATP-dependent helicase/nuclease subunit A